MPGVYPGGVRAGSAVGAIGQCSGIIVPGSLD
jgi:hypothetical protein